MTVKGRVYSCLYAKVTSSAQTTWPYLLRYIACCKLYLRFLHVNLEGASTGPKYLGALASSLWKKCFFVESLRKGFQNGVVSWVRWQLSLTRNCTHATESCSAVLSAISDILRSKPFVGLFSLSFQEDRKHRTLESIAGGALNRLSSPSPYPPARSPVAMSFLTNACLTCHPNPRNILQL